ncbi:hypothetical protein [Actibacterium lipolyticum]|uniref:Sugar-binding cellulase-like protein n=1 Tax=Actibacterium lipolyticum TaxID=1524263 RepID=A0A238JMW4_9RHOB|nr:hypothetical protein [Actibacterium lipolyticum]SMX31106.1 Sugar-binding cellulase-like protein [Actibacterium lipolyticum]
MKRILLLVIGFAPILTVLVWVSAQALASAAERQVTYRYISDALSPVATKYNAVQWLTPTVPLVRAYTSGDGDRIGQAMMDAWQALSVAQSSGRTDILTDAFSGVALERALLSVEDAQAHGGRMAVLSQTARPVFYHLDGSVFQAEVEMLVARYASDENGLIHHEVSRDTGVVTLMNETTGWRVFSYERRAAEPIAPSGAGWQTQVLNGVNYYPAESPWRDFWPTFDAKQIAIDFDRVRSLEANSVRVFLTREDFINPAESRDALANLATLLSLAEEAGLRVVPTLFDLRHDYGPGLWAADTDYLARVLPVLAASSAVEFVDLKNEPDLDFETHGRGKVEAWIRTMTDVSRTFAPDLALTVGWSAAEAATIAADTLDVVTYHDYAPLEGTQERLADVRRAVAGRDVLITEIGASSFEISASLPGSPQAQAEALSTRLTALEKADGVFVWALYDFPNVDGSVVGGSPWVQRLQAEFGLFTYDGTEKPAAEAVRRSFASEP